MEESDLDIIFTPVKLVITKKSLQVIQTKSGQHKFEIYQLLDDVIGFELFRQSASPPAPSASSGNVLALLFVGGLFGSLAYGARATSWSNIDFVLPAFISCFCLVVVGDRLFFPKNPPGLDYGLKIKLAAAPDKLLLCASRKEVQHAISEIYSFIHRGAYLSHIVILNEIVCMITQVQRHTPAE